MCPHLIRSRWIIGLPIEMFKEQMKNCENCFSSMHSLGRHLPDKLFLTQWFETSLIVVHEKN